MGVTKHLTIGNPPARPEKIVTSLKNSNCDVIIVLEAKQFREKWQISSKNMFFHNCDVTIVYSRGILYDSDARIFPLSIGINHSQLRSV